jgi:dihydrofolate synthase/folylpolyglutamate synthase
VTPREYLFSLEQIGIKLGLEQIRALLASLGHPEQAFKSIVIAGTNGKGSVTAMVDRALRAAGYACGRYTSPHLTDLEERMVIHGTPIAAGELDRMAERIREAAIANLESPPSFFEATTALALEAFRDAGVDVAVLEVGLGGRLDATNAVDSIGVAITSIDFDHQAYLGDTLEAIAAEKAGVIKPKGFVVLAENPPVVQAVVARAAADRGAAYAYVPDEVQFDGRLVDGAMRMNIRTPRAVYPEVRLSLRGRHQAGNAATAVALLERLDANVGPRRSPDRWRA